MFSALLNGLATGMILQLAIGPIFLYVASLAVYHSTADGLAAVVAVTFVDYLFIIFAVLGVGKLLERQHIKKMMGVASAVVLIIFGVMMCNDALAGFSSDLSLSMVETSLLNSFTKAFVLTAASPLTILFWTGIFTARSIEKGFTEKQLWVFGIAAGITTPLFLGSAVLVFSLLRDTISFGFASWLNLGVGIILVIYGCARFIQLQTAENKRVKKRT